mgnify:CR=1 FL=1
MKVLVTGVGGQLGYDVMNELAKRGHTGIGSDILPEVTNLDMEYVQMDITDADSVNEIVDRVAPDAVIHCAAWTAVDAAEDEENIEKVRAINAMGTDNIARACKKAGAKIIAVSSHHWQEEIPADYELRHSSGKNLFDLADVCIDDYNPVGDTVVRLPGFETPIAPVSNLTDMYIAHRLEIETARLCLESGIEPPMWRSANVPGGDEFNRALIEKYKPRIKML